MSLTDFGHQGRMRIFLTAEDFYREEDDPDDWKTSIGIGWLRDIEALKIEVYGFKEGTRP